MKVLTSGSTESFILETHGIDEVHEHEEPEVEEQNLEDEAQKMMLRWDKDNILSEIDEDKDRYQRDVDAPYSNFYDGFKSFSELQSEMTPLKGDFVHVKVTHSNPKGREILASSTILFDRIGFFEHDPLPWESSIHDGKPTLLNLSDDPIIAGLLQALLSLRQGERADVLIHPNMAYKKIGVLPIIPPNAYIFYHVKIHKVWNESDFDGMLQYERSEHMIIPLETKIELARQHKDAANQYLADNKYRSALVRYKAAIKWLSEANAEEIQKSPDYSQMMNVLWQNTAITLNRLEMHKSASKAAKQALFIDSSNVKAYYQLAKARISLGDHEGALNVLKRARRIAPDNGNLKQLHATIDNHLRDEKIKRDQIMTKMSKGLFV